LSSNDTSVKLFKTKEGILHFFRQTWDVGSQRGFLDQKQAALDARLYPLLADLLLKAGN
jgi:hypothetical protein